MAAKSIFKTEEIYLIDYEDDKGNPIVVKLHQLQIKQHKRVARVIEEAQEKIGSGEEESIVDVVIRAVAIAMETFDPKLSDPEVLGDHADWDTLNYVLEVAIGFSLNDPNLQAVVAETLKTN